MGFLVLAVAALLVARGSDDKPSGVGVSQTAGADLILTYHAADAARWLQETH